MARALDERSKKFIDAVQSDLRALSNETRRKFQPVKEVRNVFDTLKQRIQSSSYSNKDVRILDQVACARQIIIYKCKPNLIDLDYYLVFVNSILALCSRQAFPKCPCKRFLTVTGGRSWDSTPQNYQCCQSKKLKDHQR